MMFWTIAAILALLAVTPMALAMARSRGNWSASKADVEMRVYRDQLAEVERDLARGVLSEEDAKRTRVEISRRLLDADKARGAGETRATRPAVITGVVVAGACLVGGVALYNHLGVAGYADLPLEKRLETAAEIRANRPSQDEAEASAPPTPSLRAPDAEHAALMEKLRAALADRPNDLEGHILLARNEAIAGNYRAAYEAQERVIAIKGDEATSKDYSDLADMMILAAGGFVSPEAETALTRALERDSQNGAALYYSGLMFAQTGRPDMTFRLWQPLVTGSPEGAPWVPPIRAQIESVAQAAGIHYTLPPVASSDGLGGPSAEDIENASEMSDEERRDMIQSMVDGLSARLANEGGTPEEWARLISSLGVLGEAERARAIWNEAQVTFGAAPEALATVRAAAERAGVTQ
ncbi:c-type cytochrome biogenesis protein CcmI [Celeribacter sp.]|uniref:c-type cytochrome biogenesis protein CcmI n=1 Tax=Celeribacter sp. TaxID=1890673 RepID=UPI003A95476D